MKIVPIVYFINEMGCFFFSAQLVTLLYIEDVFSLSQLRALLNKEETFSLKSIICGPPKVNENYNFLYANNTFPTQQINKIRTYKQFIINTK